MNMVISVTKHLPGLSPPTLPGSLNVETLGIFHTFPPGEEDAKGAAAPGVCTHYILAWWSLGVGERNGQGVRMGSIDFWSALALGVKGETNVHAPRLPQTQDTYTYLYFLPWYLRVLSTLCSHTQAPRQTHTHTPT